MSPKQRKKPSRQKKQTSESPVTSPIFTTNYREIHQTEVEALRSIYGDDFEEVAAYLQTKSSLPPPSSQPSSTNPSQHAQDAASEQLTSELMASVHEIMQRGEQDGCDVDSQLAQAVTRAVLGGVEAGYQLADGTTDSERQRNQAPTAEDTSSTKRPRID